MAQLTQAFLFSALVSSLLIVLLTIKGNFIGRRFKLASLTLCGIVVLIVVEQLVIYSGLACQFTFLIYSTAPLYFLLAPIINQVIKSVLRSPTNRRGLLLEMIPAAGVLGGLTVFYMQPAIAKCNYLLQYTSSAQPVISTPHLVILVALVAQIGVYCYLWYRQLSSHSRWQQVHGQYSTASLPWLSLILIITGAFGYSFLLTGTARIFAPDLLSAIDQSRSVVFAFMPHAFLVLLFFVPNRQPTAIASSQDRRSARKMSIRDSQLITLKRLMDTEHLYLDSDLSLAAVAEKMDLSRHQMSALLGGAVKGNFYDFVNEYRVAHACKLMDGDMLKTFSLSGIAKEAGFNNYVSFYRTFKKVRKISPSDYIKAKNGQ